MVFPGPRPVHGPAPSPAPPSGAAAPRGPGGGQPTVTSARTGPGRPAVTSARTCPVRTRAARPRQVVAARRLPVSSRRPYGAAS